MVIAPEKLRPGRLKKNVAFNFSFHFQHLKSPIPSWITAACHRALPWGLRGQQSNRACLEERRRWSKEAIRYSWDSFPTELSKSNQKSFFWNIPHRLLNNLEETNILSECIDRAIVCFVYPRNASGKELVLSFRSGNKSEVYPKPVSNFLCPLCASLTYDIEILLMTGAS